MLNIHKVAEEAGVSVATVSRVINNQGTVAKKTQEKVEKVISRLNYEPNMLGRNLRNSESRLIMVLVPTISNPFYAQIVQGIEDIVRKENYNVFLCTTDSEPEREKVFLDYVRQKLTDGVIFMDPAVEVEMLQDLANRYPVIQCCEYNEDLNIPYISIDDTQASYKAVKHLITMGHEKIAIINSDETFQYARNRKKGYLKALEEYGLPIKDEWILKNSELNFEAGQNSMRKLLRADDKPTAIFAVSDILAIGALKRMNEEGLQAPEDIAVVGFDNIPFASMTNPALTTIAQPMYEIGSQAAKMLFQKINTPDEPVSSTLLDNELIIRESTLG
ncbi:LacI family DNA-binding transcriptional regulator [Salsuginibacillus kocurii]|uniref:LacI family DNA-binding transcriptional regulator n=1 Tax=Salsuginibacillus kocurii TaxID=427078 RepID=UPI000360F8FD|nr:LacI family DNA-binding transcriptional regulator [Salsuginibacillus kocurii]